MEKEFQEQESEYQLKFREDEELEFFTELALHETERWIQAVTKKNLSYPDDTRKSLENGELLCELLNSLKPGAVKRINQLSTPIAGLDNINVFLKACKTHFGLSDANLFNSSDLEDLSQRAIAESDHLKEEYDKRLRNVSITIYWLGKYASRNFQGPQLDLSAFAALVHHKHEPDIVDKNVHSDRAFSNSWDWSIGERGRSDHIHIGVEPGEQPYQHMENSFESCEKESVNSLEEYTHDSSSNMSMTRYGSASVLNRNQHLHQHDSRMGEDRHTSLYHSTPDLANTVGSHRRYSSTDSMDGSHHSGHSGHSRPNSDIQEVSYPTRSTSVGRKISSSADPLQFIKLKGAQDLAHTAEVQMRVAAESKKTPIPKSKGDEDADWQTNLSTWKNRRKSQSERAYHLKDELEQMEREKYGDAGPALPAKTFSQMADERNRRRSTGLNKFYPIDDEEDDAFAHVEDKKTEPLNLRQISKPKDGIAAWARDSDDEENDKKNMGVSRNPIKNSPTASDLNDQNKNSHTTSQNDKYQPFQMSARSRLSHNFHACENDDGNATFSELGGKRRDRYKFEDSDLFSTKGSLLKSCDDNNLSRTKDEIQNNDIGNKRESPSHLEKDSQIRQILNENLSRQDNVDSATNEGFSKTKDMLSKNGCVSEPDNNASKITTSHVGYRTQKKIGHIMKNFEESESKRVAPKSGYNEKIDISARISTFENSQQDNNKVYGNQDNFRGMSSDDGSSEEESFEDGGISPDCFKANSLATTPQLELSPQTAMIPDTTICESLRKKEKDFVEKNIRISQTPDSDKGFGFFLTGGVDKNEPITVSKVSLGSAADLFELKAEDVVLSVNQANVSDMTSSDVGDIISKAVDVGLIDIWVKRKIENDDFEDEEFSSSDEGEENIMASQYHKTELTDSETISLTEDVRTENVHDSSTPKAAVKIDQEIRINTQNRHPPSVFSPHYSNIDNDPYSPLSSNIQHSFNSSMNQEEDSDGPPAILRKWQRQRQKEEYTFDTGSEQTDAHKRISLNAPLPRTESARSRTTEIHESEEFNHRPAQPWDEQMEEWTNQQGQVKQEEEIWQQQREKDRLLEECRAESRAKIQQGAATCALSSPLKQNQTPDTHSSTMTFSVKGQPQPQRQQQFFGVQPTLGASQITIDPRNRHTSSDGEAPVQFQVKVGNQHAIDQRAALLEAERDRIRQEELMKIEKERQRVERELKAKEMDEMRRFKEKEEEIERKKEMLQLEREKFHREQEEFKREREQQLQHEQQQLHQQSFSNPPQQYYTAISSNADQSRFEAPQNMREHSLDSDSTVPFNFQRPEHPKRYSASHQDTHHPPQKSGYQEYQSASVSTRYSPKLQSLHKDQEWQKQDMSWGTDIKQSTNSLPKWPPPATGPNQDRQANSGGSEQTSSGKRLSRDEMLAMNRKPTPKQVLPAVQQAVDEASVQQNNPPITREAPSRGQIVSLNSAPRARLKEDKEWYSSVSSLQKPHTSSFSQPDQQRFKAPWAGGKEAYGGKKYSFAGPGDHWLVQEAERRRLIESGKRQQANRFEEHDLSPSNQYPGPIKPAIDRPNQWRDNSGYDVSRGQKLSLSRTSGSMPAAIRQTLLQRTAGARGSNELAPSCAPSYHHQDNYQYQSNLPLSPRGHHHHQNQQPLSLSSDHQSSANVPPLSQAPAAPGENGKPVSGAQLCSHCNQELGFGAAMVIESLGLFYHVQCFRCYVCHASLGTGVQGADVRVRVNKLHCPNCYSNDEAGLKFSKV